MEQSIINKVYDYINQIIHPSENSKVINQKIKRCPVTGLDISMQAKYTKFLTASGVEWYYMHEREIYYQFLSIHLSPESLNKDMKSQYKQIAHNIRNVESNKRNNAKRAIQKLLDDKSSLFNNLQLIDKNKLKDAGLTIK